MTPQEAQNEMKIAYQKIRAEAKKLIGKNVTLLVGKYKGRRAQIWLTSVDVEGNVTVVARVYRKRGSYPEFIVDDGNTRTYISVNSVRLEGGKA